MCKLYRFFCCKQPSRPAQSPTVNVSMPQLEDLIALDIVVQSITYLPAPAPLMKPLRPSKSYHVDPPPLTLGGRDALDPMGLPVLSL